MVVLPPGAATFGNHENLENLENLAFPGWGHEKQDKQDFQDLEGVSQQIAKYSFVFVFGFYVRNEPARNSERQRKWRRSEFPTCSLLT